MKFRTDINGLRAYAVLAVIIFHFNKNWLPGGFAGVDVFFVISGYLMTSIIFRGLERGNLSLWKFYSARIGRIIPALIILISLLLVFGYLFLPPIPYKDLAKHSGGSLLFISNFMFWKESGYFDASALDKYLLHTWSLSVEWQFYLLYPLVLLVLSKFITLKNVKKIIILISILAFIFSIFASYRWPIASYFLLPTRIWEMLLGGIIFLYPCTPKNQSLKFYIEFIGLILIILSFFLISEDVVWPGYMAIIPTIGAFLLLQANHQGSLLTNNFIFQKIGLWSYSLYLYHWPLLVINHTLNLNLSFWVFLFITFVLSIISYYGIEKKRWKTSCVFAMAILLFILISIIYKSNGVENRIEPQYRLTSQEYHSKFYGGSGYPSHQESYLNADDGIYDYFIFGDSFARQYAKYIDQKSIKSRNWFGDGCLFLNRHMLLRNNVEFEVCSKEGLATFALLKDEINSPIIWAQSWSSYDLAPRGSQDTPIRYNQNPVAYNNIINNEISALSEITNSNIYLIGMPIKAPYNAFNCLAATNLIGSQLVSAPCDTHFTGSPHKINALLQEIADGHKNVYYIDPNDALCSKTDEIGKYNCSSIVENNPVFSDTSHLSIYGAEIVANFIFNTIGSLENKINK